MSYNDWAPAGAAPTLTDPQSGEAANAWNTAEMKSALLNKAAHQTPPTTSHETATDTATGQDNTLVAEGWVDAQPYNYEAYSAEAPATWDGNARVYEYDGESGEVGPEVPELELQLFGDVENRVGHGIDFSK